MIDNILDWILFIVASFINGFFGESWSDDIEFAEMPSAYAILTTAIILIMMREVIICQMVGGLHEKFTLSFTLFLIVLKVVGL